MKILFAIKSMHHTHGGAERVLANVTAGLAERGHEIQLVTFDQPGGQSVYPLHEKIERIYIPVGDSSKKSTLYETLLRMQALRKCFYFNKPQIIVAFMHSMFVPASLSSIGVNIPVIGSEHIVPDHYRSRRIEFFLLLLASFFMPKITVLSDKVKVLYPKFLQKKMIAMPNPIFFASNGAKNRVEKKRKIILNVGRLDAQKDQKTLIEAFALLSADYPEWDLKIVGEGALRSELMTLIGAKKLQDRVFLPGIAPDIASEYEAADIFAMSSRYESFGLATAEAMAFGLPAVGFADCPGTNEIIADGENGILVQDEDRIKAFANGLKDLMDDPDRRSRYGEQGREGVKIYSLERVTENWQRLLKEMARP